MQTISVPYGDGFVSAQVPDEVQVEVVAPKKEPVTTPIHTLIETALDNPIGSQRLEDLVKTTDKIVIIVNDHTRPSPNVPMVDAILKRLHNKGISEDSITFVVATGSHRAPTDEELNGIVGEQNKKRYTIISHDCQDRSTLVYLGKTESGLPLWINKYVAESDFIITTGLIAPHSAAGFSGGRKSIVPGVAGLDTLKIHHSLPLRPFNHANGNVKDNRFHETAVEAARRVNVRFILNAIQDMHKQNVCFVAGDLVAAHEKGMCICRESNTVKIEDLADIVIASPGGTPRDSDLYQAQKALAVAEALGKPNCTFLLCARSEQGIGEGLFREWLETANSAEEVVERFRVEGFNVGSNKAFMYARALLKGRVVIVSHLLDKEELKKMMLDGASTLQEALDDLLLEGKDKRILVLPHAVNMIVEK